MTLISVTWNVNSLITRNVSVEPRLVELQIKMLKSLILHIFFQLLQTTTKNTYTFVCYEIVKAGNFRPGLATL